MNWQKPWAERVQNVYDWAKIGQVRTLRENQLKNKKAKEPFCQALDMELNVMKTTPHQTREIRY